MTRALPLELDENRASKRSKYPALVGGKILRTVMSPHLEVIIMTKILVLLGGGAVTELIAATVAIMGGHILAAIPLVVIGGLLGRAGYQVWRDGV